MRAVYPLKCQITPEDGVTRVDVYDDIGEGGFFSDGLTAKAFGAQLRAVKGALEVHINSGGGDVFDGIAIGNAIRKHKGAVSTVVDGLAASIASVIAQAGNDRVMEPGSMMMVHDAFGMCVGNAAEMAKMTQTLDENSDNIAGIYAERAGGTPEQWRAVMKDETWYTAEQAVAAGLADRVGEREAALPAGLDLAAVFPVVPGRIAAQLRTMPVTAAAAPSDKSCAEMGHECCKTAGTMDRAAKLSNAVAEEHGHPGRECWDPDGDGDCDLTPGGDTDHDYWSPDGEQLQGVPGHPMDGALTERIRAIVREELRAAWDGPAAMSRAANSDNPATAFRSICAGRRDGDPALEKTWALPHHDNPGGPPNPDGVSAALGRLDQTQGLVNKDAARAHLEKHQAGEHHGTEDHAHTDLSGMDLGEIRAALKGASE